MLVKKQGSIEAIIHAMTQRYAEMASDGLLLVDADNCFNRINRNVIRHNVAVLCPVLSMVIENFYCSASRLFVNEGWGSGREFGSFEGTTQGCPLGSAMCAIGIMPLINLLRPENNGNDPSWPLQIFYADDGQGVGKILQLCNSVSFGR